jgi:hypothetical protein
MKMKWVILVPLALILMGILVMSSCSKAAAPASTTVSVPTAVSTTQAPLIPISTPTSIPTSTPVSTPTPTLTTTLTPTPTPTLTPTPTPAPTSTLHFLSPTNTPAPAPTGVIPWDQALKLTCNGQTITVTGKVYDVFAEGYPPLLSLGAPRSEGFTVFLSDLTKFPADLTAAYLGKTIEATGIFYNKVGSGTGPGTLEISITVSDQSQIKVIE